MARAVALAPGRGAGTLAWVRSAGRAEAAVVLEPELPLAAARLAFLAAANALADALAARRPAGDPGGIAPGPARCGSTAPPAARCGWPHPPGCAETDIPDWLVVGMEARITLTLPVEPGERPDLPAWPRRAGRTLTAAELTAGWARHLMAGLDDWQAKGPRRLSERYLARLMDEREVAGPAARHRPRHRRPGAGPRTGCGAAVRCARRWHEARQGKAREEVSSLDPPLFLGVGTCRAAGARPTKRKGGVRGGNTFPSPTLPSLAMKLPRTLRLDPSDLVVFTAAAAPGEWAVPGGFAFWDEDPAALAGKRRQEFRAGFLGLASFGWSTLVEVAEATPDQREQAAAALAAHIQRRLWRARCGRRPRRGGGGDRLRRHPLRPPARHRPGPRPGGGGRCAVRERFRTLHRRETPHRDFGALPVFAILETEGEDARDTPT